MVFEKNDEDSLERARVCRKLIQDIRIKQLGFLGHVVRRLDACWKDRRNKEPGKNTGAVDVKLEGPVHNLWFQTFALQFNSIDLYKKITGIRKDCGLYVTTGAVS